MPGTRKRVPLFDEEGQRIRGKQNKEAADVALAREQLSWDGESAGLTGSGGAWIVARVCSEYLQYCERGVAKGSMSRGHRDDSKAWLNDLCEYCGALSVAQLKVELRKGHVQHWVESHSSWRSPVTQRNAMTVVLSAFHHA